MSGDSFDGGSRQDGRQVDGRVLVGTFNTLVNRALGGEGSKYVSQTAGGQLHAHPNRRYFFSILAK